MRLFPLLVLLATTALAHAGPRVAIVTDSRGFVHGVVKPTDGDSTVVTVLRDVVTNMGGELVHVPDASELELEGLDVVAFYTTGPIPLDVPAFVEWVEAGGGMLGIHCATDTLKQDPQWVKLIGGRFDGHPWNAGDDVVLRSLEPHPVNEPIGERRELKEEIYAFANFDDTAHVHVELDKDATPKKADKGYVPVAWTKPVGEGRVAYTSLGHRRDVWESDWFQQHLTALIDYADEGEQAAAAPERGHDPWVFRCVLDKRPRVVVAALSPDLWVAYDATTASLYKAWTGGMDFTGSVYDTRHGPQPRTLGEPLEVFGERPQWLIPSRPDEPVAVRWLGHQVHGTEAVTFTYELEPGDRPIRVEETPRIIDDRTLFRRFRVSGLDGRVLQFVAATNTVDVTLQVTYSGFGRISAVERGGGDVTIVRFERDGVFEVVTVWPEEETP
jgi:type 1 glutamine amidotransferase